MNIKKIIQEELENLDNNFIIPSIKEIQTWDINKIRQVKRMARERFKSVTPDEKAVVEKWYYALSSNLWAVEKKIMAAKQKAESHYRVPTIEEIRTWSDERLTDLNWVRDRVYNASGESKMLMMNWRKNIMSRIDQVRKERGIS